MLRADWTEAIDGRRSKGAEVGIWEVKREMAVGEAGPARGVGERGAKGSVRNASGVFFTPISRDAPNGGVRAPPSPNPTNPASGFLPGP